MKYFGTDGIRDRVNGPLLHENFVYRLGRAIGLWLSKTSKSSSYHVAIGRDTRASAGYLFLALARGLNQEGIRIFDAGVCPTPAVAGAIRMLGLDMGIVITASHNPASDNGIKLFGRGGVKLRPRDEQEIEVLLDALPRREADASITPPVRYYEARRHYLESYEHILPDQALMGMRIVLDCANGATYRTSSELLSRFGALVITRGCRPDGDNINLDCGSEHPEVISNAVEDQAADIGIAHDGDGDRVILCDSTGQILDGDAVMAILGTGWARRKLLAKNTLVATIMSNLGLDNCLEQAGVTVNRVGVGDRQVFYEMRDKGYNLGGESSGHFIAMDYLPTGDGLLAALLILNEMIRSGNSLAELAAVFRPFPQIKKNVAVRKKLPFEEIPGLQKALNSLEKKAGKKGRILLRYSGTEPKVRLLAEAEDETLARKVFADLEEVVERHLLIDR